MHELDQMALASIKKGSVSFSLASLFFSREQRIMAAQIYMWCRHCDDVIDEGEGDFDSLKELRDSTLMAWEFSQAHLEAPFRALGVAAKKSQMPSYYALELINGMEMDLQGKVYQTVEDLKLYCYRVASTVGLMMCHVMGIFKSSALKEAAALGMAMQLTNICRDVKTDYEMKRLYLPLELLKKHNLHQDNYFRVENRAQLYQVVVELLDESERLYTKGLEGIKHLPLRSAFTVLLAGKIYREIGREMLSLGPPALDRRTVVSGVRKISLLISCLFDVMFHLPGRIINPQKTVVITETWKYI